MMNQFDKERQRQMAINQTQSLLKQGITAPVIPVVIPKPKMGPTDRSGTELKVGMKVARAVIQARSPVLNICEVTSIVGDRVFLDNSKQSLHYPNRVLVLK